jgi:hypothetical protein
VILARRLSAGEKNIAPLDPGNHPGKEKVALRLNVAPDERFFADTFV